MASSSCVDVRVRVFFIARYLCCGSHFRPFVLCDQIEKRKKADRNIPLLTSLFQPFFDLLNHVQLPPLVVKEKPSGESVTVRGRMKQNVSQPSPAVYP